MSENTKTEGLSISQNSTDTDNNLNSSEKVQVDKGSIEKIEDTVFSIANSPEQGWFLAIGKEIITKPMPTRKECLDQLEKDKWNIIFKMIILVTEKALEVNLDERERKTI